MILLSAVAAGRDEGARPKTEPGGLFQPARNGLVAYSYDGDIYVGDPVTGVLRH